MELTEEGKWSETKIDFMEKQIPDLMAAAVVIARNDLWAAGISVIHAEGDDIVEQFPDGTKVVIGKINSRTEN